ncbi:sugar phosphate nucleotidyltransferase, partial [Clostridium perfringens]
EDELDPNSSNDFGKNIIPKMLNAGKRLIAYPFKGYWKDVGTIESLWEANMDLLKHEDELSLYDSEWRIYSANPVRPAQFIGKDAEIKSSLTVEGCIVHGKVENSVLFQGVYVGKGAVIKDAVIMPNTRIEDEVVIEKAIIGSEAIVGKGCKIGDGNKISVIASKEVVVGNKEIIEECAMVK